VSATIGEPVRHAARIVRVATEPFLWLSVVYFTMLGLRTDWMDRIPGWFYIIQDKHVGPPAFLVGLAAVPVAAWFVGRRLRTRRLVAVSLLVVLGFILQQGFAWSEGRGLAGMRDRIVNTGHAEFAEVAVRQPRMWDVLVNYESKVQNGELGDYARSKPPGQLLFYMITARLARPFAANPSRAARLAATRTLAAVSWPLLSYLVLFPLFLALRAVVVEDVAFLACQLYIVVPAVTLITLHTDQCLFPLLCMTTIWVVTEAERRRSAARAFAAGALLYIAAFCTFPLLLVAPVAAAFAIAVECQAKKTDARWRALAKTGIAAALGFAAMFALFAVAFHYDFVARLRSAADNHVQWKGSWHGGPAQTLQFALLDYIEFAVWIGLPVALLGMGAARRAMLAAAGGDFGGMVLPSIVLTALLIYLGCFGKTEGETSRLWLFLVPVCCALAAVELFRRDIRDRGLMISTVFVLQWLTVYFAKGNRDFW
jgi:hypothetical protein